MSSALATVPSGTVRFVRARASSLLHAPAAIGVSTPPGQMQLARTPRGPYCTATSRVSAFTPPLLDVYAAPYP